MSGPDENINVVATLPDGTAKVYGHSDGRSRPLLYTKGFPSYGAAKVWAQDYEADQRAKVRTKR